MAIALRPKFSIPNRSRQIARSKKAEDGVVDIGWCEGVLSDGRPFRAEMWAQDQVSLITFFFSSEGLEDLSNFALRQLVDREQLVRFKPGSPKHCDSRTIQDDAGNQMWSVNVVVGDEDQTFLSSSVPVFAYSKCGDPDTMYNPTPITAARRLPASS